MKFISVRKAGMPSYMNNGVLPGLAWVGVCAKMVIQRGDDHGRYRAVSVFIRFEVPVEC